MTPPRRRRPRTAFHSKIDHLPLAPADRAAYAAVLIDPRTTVDAAHAWLRARGHDLSRSAVARHRRRFLADRQDAEQDAARAAAFARLAADHPPDALWAGTLARHQQLLMDRLMAVDDPSELTIADFRAIMETLRHAIEAERALAALRQVVREGKAAKPDAAAPAESPDARRERLTAEVARILTEAAR